MSNQRTQNVRRGEAHHSATLTERDVKQMRKLKKEYDLCIRCISKMYGVSYGTAWDAINYQTWKHVRDS